MKYKYCALVMYQNPIGVTMILAFIILLLNTDRLTDALTNKET